MDTPLRDDADRAAQRPRAVVRVAGGLALATLVTLTASVAYVLRLQTVDVGQRGPTIAVMLEIVVLAATVVFFGWSVLAQTRLVERHERDLVAHAEHLESQATQLEGQAVELEHENDEARALASQLEASNEGLRHALTDADRAREPRRGASVPPSGH